MGKSVNRGSKNNQWKGDGVGYRAVHTYVRRRKEKPAVCVICKDKEPLDLANISQKYKRDLNDWEWLCRKCHMLKDGRLEKTKKRFSLKRLMIHCKRGHEFNEENTRWFVCTGGTLCRDCRECANFRRREKSRLKLENGLDP